MSYIATCERWNRQYLDVAAFGSALCAALGGTKLETEAGEHGRVCFEVDGQHVYITGVWNKLGRAVVHAGLTQAERCALVRRTVPKFPEATVDTARPMAALVKDVRRRVIEPAAAPLAQARAMVAAEAADKASLAAAIADLRARFPLLRVDAKEGDTTASVYANVGHGTYLTGRLEPGGALYIDRCTVRGDRVAAVLAAMLQPEA